MRHKLWLVPILILALFLLGGGSYAVYTRYFTQPKEPAAPTPQTATVTQGDLVITADGSGELVPAVELELGFRVGGTLSEVLVSAGDHVKKGDLLARLDTADLERALAEVDVRGSAITHHLHALSPACPLTRPTQAG